MLLIKHLLIFILCVGVLHSVDVEETEDEYYYYYYYDEEEIPEEGLPVSEQREIEHQRNAHQSSQELFEAETLAAMLPFGFEDEAAPSSSVSGGQSPRKYGFKKSPGSGIKKTMTPIVNAKLIEEMSSRYGCFLKKNSGPQKVLDPTIRVKEVAGNRTSEQQSVARRSLNPKDAAEVKQRAKEEEEKKMKVRYPMGSPCESLVCASCKIVIEEFGRAESFLVLISCILGRAVHQAISDPKYAYLYDVTEDFCGRITQLYSPIVSHFCDILMDETKGYRELVVGPFEQDQNLEEIASTTGLSEKEKRICVSVGACLPSQFVLSTEPEERTQEQWSQSCYVCQAAMRDIEDRISLMNMLGDGASLELSLGVCDRLGFKQEFDADCRQLLKDQGKEDIAWMSKMHHEVIKKKELGSLRFPDRVCEAISNQATGKKFCEKWIDPDQLRRKTIEETIEPVFY